MKMTSLTHLMGLLLISILSLVNGTCNTTLLGSNIVILDPSVGFTLNYIVQESYIYIDLSATLTSSWFGFGIGEDTSGSMKGADIVTCSITSGTITCDDRYVPFEPYSFSSGLFGIYPQLDVHNDWEIIQGFESNGTMSVRLRRLLNTNDHQDRIITSNGNHILWAYGTGTSPSYHGGNRGSLILNLFQSPSMAQPPLPVSDSILTFRMSNYSIPTEITSYTCQSFKLPDDASRHVIAIEPVINQAAIVHHMILYICKNDYIWSTFLNNPAICVGDNALVQMPCVKLMFGWARGGGPLILPSTSGFPIGPASTDNNYVVLEIHYNNAQQTTGIVDTSGVMIHIQNQRRQYDAASLTLGDIALSYPDIPPNQADVHYQAQCPGTETSKFPNSITVFGSFLHMHSVGQRIYTTRYAANGTYIGTDARVDYWDSGFQAVQRTSPYYVVAPGEIMYTHCHYNTEHISNPVPIGLASSSEMCLNFLFYYPRMTIVQDGTLSVIDACVPIYYSGFPTALFVEQNIVPAIAILLSPIIVFTVLLIIFIVYMCCVRPHLAMKSQTLSSISVANQGETSTLISKQESSTLTQERPAWQKCLFWCCVWTVILVILVAVIDIPIVAHYANVSNKMTLLGNDVTLFEQHDDPIDRSNDPLMFGMANIQTVSNILTTASVCM